MKIVVDENVPLAAELFGAHGEICLVNGRSISLTDVKDAEALICRSVTPVNERLLSDSKVEFVGSCTIGTDHLDAEYLQHRRIRWAHAPGCNAQSVIEYVAGCLSLVNMLDANSSVGVIGCGNVGGGVYDQLTAIGMSCSAYDPIRQQDELLNDGKRYTSLDEAMSSDIVCMHAPFTTTEPFPSKAMVGYSELARLKPNAVVISAGRGGIIDERALIKIAGERPDIRWMLDVWENEPNIARETYDLAAIATPHIAGYSLNGKQNGSRQVYDAFCDHFGFDAAQSSLIGATPDLIVTEKITSLNQLILHVYDPTQDSERMDESLQANQSGWFDRLRKTYPVRHERSAYLFENVELTNDDRATAERIGFRFG